MVIDANGYKQSSNVAWFVLLTIQPADDDPPLRFVNNLEPVQSRGNTFEAFPFAIVLPEDTDDGQPTVKLQIDNVDQQLTEVIRELLEPPTVLLEIVLSNHPDEVERSISNLILRDVTYDAFTITGTLQTHDVLSAKFPPEQYVPTIYPDLFY